MTKLSISELVDRIIEDNHITRAEQQMLNTEILADGVVSPEERAQINRLWDLIKAGKIKVRD